MKKGRCETLAYVTIPKDLSRIIEQGPVRADQTTRICFPSGGAGRRAAFLWQKVSLGTTTAALCMILVMLPFFLFAM